MCSIHFGAHLFDCQVPEAALLPASSGSAWKVHDNSHWAIEKDGRRNIDETEYFAKKLADYRLVELIELEKEVMVGEESYQTSMIDGTFFHAKAHVIDIMFLEYEKTFRLS
eukprot:TRINITY_DN18319_c0_g1_i1.p3 TRINITY_DN18319_c0_g1~~TRINITY_DN18319_c0_g1_i1.p3  ORF type:complete len:111 (-),score=15.34 TRINITY_DN18319_c0_g1_i1:782-1114(-)